MLFDLKTDLIGFSIFAFGALILLYGDYDLLDRFVYWMVDSSKW